MSRCEDGTFTVVTGALNRPTSLEFIGTTAYVVTLAERSGRSTRLQLALRRHTLSNWAWAADHLAGNHGATTTGSAGFPDCRVAPADPKWDLTGARRQQPERSRAGYRLVSQAAWVLADPSGSVANAVEADFEAEGLPPIGNWISTSPAGSTPSPEARDIHIAAHSTTRGTTKRRQTALIIQI